MWKTICLVAILMGGSAAAQEKRFALSAPQELIDTGLMRHVLPRFSLKTGIRITVDPDAQDAVFGAEGVPVFRNADQIWHLAIQDGPHPAAFRDWLQSEVGKRTIEGFAPEGEALFSTDVEVETVTEVAAPTGDVVLGEALSLSHCGRCHVVNASNRMNAIGSTPSFGLMRNFEDWEGRFLAFYALKPHPAFTQIEDVTDPFPDNLPSPISPLELTLDQVDAIVAYVATIPPADLGAPVRSQ